MKLGNITAIVCEIEMGNTFLVSFNIALLDLVTLLHVLLTLERPKCFLG